MINSNDLLSLAHTLHQQDEAEVYQREAIIASYYSVFHHCRILASGLNNHASGAHRQGSHEELINKLSLYPTTNTDGLPTESARKLKSLGYQLKSARDSRRIASYELDNTISTTDVKQHLAAINRMIDTLIQLQTTHPTLF